MIEKSKPKQPVRWRNVAALVLLGSPLFYVADRHMPHAGDGPGISSPEGRRILMEFVARTWPEVFRGGVIR